MLSMSRHAARAISVRGLAAGPLCLALCGCPFAMENDYKLVDGADASASPEPSQPPGHENTAPEVDAATPALDAPATPQACKDDKDCPSHHCRDKTCRDG
jgi:hypothetical protein